MPEFTGGSIVASTRKIKVTDPTDLRGWLASYEYSTYGQNKRARVYLEYDAYDGSTQFGRGKRTALWDGCGRQSVWWDKAGRMTKEERTLDGDSVRRKRLDSQGTIHYVGPYERNVGNGLNPAEVVTKYYAASFGGLSRLIAFRRAGTLYWVGTDQLGSTMCTADAGFTPADQMRYRPHGARGKRSADRPAGNRCRFLGVNYGSGEVLSSLGTAGRRGEAFADCLLPIALPRTTNASPLPWVAHPLPASLKCYCVFGAGKLALWHIRHTLSVRAE